MRKQDDDHQKVRSKAFTDNLARQAANFLRLEMTFIGSKRIRGLFNLPTGSLPTFQAMAQTQVEQYVIWREMAELRLDDLAETNMAYDEGVSFEKGPADELLHRVITTINERAAGDPDLHENLVRKMALAMRYITANIPADTVSAWNGGSGESSIKKLDTDLRRLGLPPLSQMTPGAHELLRRFTDALRAQLP